MTAEEKKTAYDFLKTVSSWCCGYTPPEFLASPEFEDDTEPELIQETTPPETTAQPNQSEPSAEKEQGATLGTIADKIASCQNCMLCRTRTNTVPGEGIQAPVVMVIGEGPGEDEDKTGRPFVGKAGQLLDKMLAAISLGRTSNCYIANIVKCRPPMNRTPMPDEAAACSGFLQAQIHILKPRYILALGRTAAQNLLNTEQGINSLRGKWFDYNLGARTIPLLATYHPSALLRNESLKRPAWEDLKAFKARIIKEIPDYAEPFYVQQSSIH
ncbi:uracil-DNA glycosylase [Treponema sp.]|uniref:uracil-DNA glycosylase n=1 Tax=Treponema sp. TaxID=166 RepID=UPI003F05A1A4